MSTVVYTTTCRFLQWPSIVPYTRTTSGEERRLTCSNTFGRRLILINTYSPGHGFTEMDGGQADPHAAACYWMLLSRVYGNGIE